MDHFAPSPPLPPPHHNETASTSPLSSSLPPASLPLVSPELLLRYDCQGPRYTSYPPATCFTSDFTATDYENCLSVAAPKRPFSLYVHLPFCAQRCFFCACNAMENPGPTRANAYLDLLLQEISMVTKQLHNSPKLTELHLGGGTPSFYDISSLARLHETIYQHFSFTPDAECAIEVDPRVSTTSQLRAFRSFGHTRISLGVQDFDPGVQAAIGRYQTKKQTHRVMETCRELAFSSINIDILQGLPRQTPDSFRCTLEEVIRLRPDRLAIYSFAYLPAAHPNQRNIKANLLPCPKDRLKMRTLTDLLLTEAGYIRIGMDHFALATDDLACAQAQNRLSRTFMGYTTKKASDTIGVGVSAIGDIAGSYVQNHKRLHAYAEAIEHGRLPTARGYTRSVDDEIRRSVITQLMCNFYVEWEDIRQQFGIDPLVYFASERARLADPKESTIAGLVVLSDKGIHLSPHGTLFPRNVAMFFDQFSQSDAQTARRVFSRTL